MDWILTNIGPRLKELRKNRGLTLAELGTSAACSEGFLSGIENGSIIPSISALSVIAAVLGADVSAFFPEEEKPAVVVHRANDVNRLMISSDSAESYKILSSRFDNPSYTALRHVLFQTENGGTYLHYGERFAVILRGQVTVLFGQKEYHLGPGECIHYSPHPDHKLIVDSETELLWLVSPALIR
ncbi:MAG: Cro/Cl family transcriptional regulator [Subtercola sp.]|uniref:helix-turn-helix domain-containing protein n=1 Tax=Subtercola endophyticus TaxID=2895559 RepID=UPI001E5AB2F4|nr:helix-turn-helix domain-containing protein [Subtercola endophyticus]MCU1482584.1 Cro/Cl family transcriptional regulator [Subtercola sp.]UFS58244.1 helix-turn-helix domain-containing protein [Subtercola endophyticus]